MKLLALDTATEACSAALYLDGEIKEVLSEKPRSHADKILSLVDELLTEAGTTLNRLDAIAFDRGPGSFTGVRIGTSVAQGLALGSGLPLIPVSSLMALAQGAWRRFHAKAIIAMLDARMDEIYWSAYRVVNDRLEVATDERLDRPQEVKFPQGAWSVAGSGWSAYENILSKSDAVERRQTFAEMLPQAADVAVLAEKQWRAQGGVEPEQALPVYLRHNVAAKKS